MVFHESGERYPLDCVRSAVAGAGIIAKRSGMPKGFSGMRLVVSERCADIDKLMLDKLLKLLDRQQKANKIKNLLQALKSQSVVEVKGTLWRMSKDGFLDIHVRYRA